MQAVDHSSSIVCSQASSESVLLQIAMPALPPVTATTDSDEPDPPRKRPSKKAKASPKKTPKKDEALPEKTPTKPKSKASPKASCGCVIASMSHGYFFACTCTKPKCDVAEVVNLKRPAASQEGTKNAEGGTEAKEAGNISNPQWHKAANAWILKQGSKQLIQAPWPHCLRCAGVYQFRKLSRFSHVRLVAST